MKRYETPFMQGLRLIHQAQDAGAITFMDAVKLLRTLVGMK